VSGRGRPDLSAEPRSGSSGTAPVSALDGGWGESLVAWQRSHGRHDLPWQHSREPYRVWLSEIMLQQTQVATVIGYYDRFLQRFPDLDSLAAAALDDVLALWSGLGYYSRARHLHRCAQVLVHEHGGTFPRDAAALARLPGIGPSTAAAIAAFCFGQREAILDGNVKRVLARALGVADDLARPTAVQALHRQARTLLPPNDIGVYTQGLMDLGATVCTPRAPRCTLCPWSARCAAHREGRPEAYPVKSRRLVRRAQQHALLLLTHRDAVWLVQRPRQGIWAGLWCLPQFDDPKQVQALAAPGPGVLRPLPPFTHVLTHRDLRLEPYHWVLPARLDVHCRAALEDRLPAGRWMSAQQALGSGLPAPVRRLLGEHLAACPAAPRDGEPADQPGPTTPLPRR